MSQWRRIAIEEVPCCKNIIEEATHPAVMWNEMASVICREFNSEAPDEEIIQQIYRFALRCKNKRSSNEHSGDNVGFFFQSVFHSGCKVEQALRSQISSSEYSELKKVFGSSSDSY